MSLFERPNPTINFPNGIQHKEHPVTDHMQAAIEAGAEALAQHQLDGDFNCECGHEHPNGSGDNFPAWREALRTHEAKVTLHAAEPHLRAMIAQEILDCVDDIPPNGLPYYRDGIYAGMVSAAILIRGPQE